MKPFRLTPKVKAFVERKYRRKAQVVNHTVSEMERVMFRAIDEIMASAHTGTFHPPDLSEMDEVTEGFYHNVIRKGWESAEDEKATTIGEHKKLARLPKGAIPKDLNSLEKIFRNKKFWPNLMKRSSLLTDRLRKAYLNKLKKKFQEIVPQMLAGEASPEEVKEELRKAWGASKSRVETIFRVETTSYFAETQRAYFEDDPDIIGFLFDSVADTSRTEICRSRHGLVYKPGTALLRKNTPALHYNCRSHLLALANIPSNRKLLEDPQRDPTKKKVAPLPKGFDK